MGSFTILDSSGRIERRKCFFFHSKFWISRIERESVCKISFIREEKEKFSSKSHSFEKRNFLQNHEFWEENKSFIFEILTIKNIEKWKFYSPARDSKKWTISSQDQESRQCHDVYTCVCQSGTGYSGRHFCISYISHKWYRK